QGYDVVGVFMKNWDEQDENGVCTSTADWEDVQDVCHRIDIPFYAVSFEKEYRERVFSHFLEEYRKGRTPNPDVLCNREIKFKAFLEFAMKLGADKLATGHFAQTEIRDGCPVLLRGADPKKDQSYFLYMLNEKQLEKAVFPVGGLTKAQVRDIAREHGLSVSEKKDSTGVCFIGERNFRAFLKNYLPAMPGDMRTEAGEKVGGHIGLAYYTPGQRKGLGIGGRGDGRSWFVLDKDLPNNVLIVGQGEDHPRLFSHIVEAAEPTWIAGGAPMERGDTFRCTVKFRYRQADQQVSVTQNGDTLMIEADEPQRAVTPGQSVVFYRGEQCLGGAIAETVHQIRSDV
ncbi:MAG: tRNA 2-thiouridine(34) synthase MnmA, partial [Bacillota bacterium]